MGQVARVYTAETQQCTLHKTAKQRKKYKKKCMNRHGSIKRVMTRSQKKKDSDKDIYSTDEEDRLDELNQEVDQLMEDVFGIPF